MPANMSPFWVFFISIAFLIIGFSGFIGFYINMFHHKWPKYVARVSEIYKERTTSSDSDINGYDTKEVASIFFVTNNGQKIVLPIPYNEKLKIGTHVDVYAYDKFPYLFHEIYADAEYIVDNNWAFSLMSLIFGISASSYAFYLIYLGFQRL